GPDRDWPRQPVPGLDWWSTIYALIGAIFSAIAFAAIAVALSLIGMLALTARSCSRLGCSCCRRPVSEHCSGSPSARRALQRPRGAGREGLRRQAGASKLTGPHRTRTPRSPTSQINERRQPTANSQSARDRARRHFGFGAYTKHHPFGLILPSTTLHEFGGAHCRHPSHS